MNELLKAFLDLQTELSQFETSYHEDVEVVTIKYHLLIDQLSVIDTYEKNFSTNEIGFEAHYQNQNVNYQNLIMSLRFLDDKQDFVDITLLFNKKIRLELTDNTFVFFRKGSFFNCFNTSNHGMYLRLDKSKEVSVHVPLDQEFHNGFISLYPVSGGVIRPARHKKEDIQSEEVRIRKTREELTRINSEFPVPEFFMLDGLPNDYKEFFSKNLFNMSLFHLGNKITDENNVIIKGHKNTEITLTTDYIPLNSKVLYRIFKFAYEEKHYTDKIEITRNILTIYLNTTESAKKLDDLLPNIENTISSHFSAYIQDSIKKFFNDRKDVIKEAHKYATDLKNEADKLLLYINTSLLGIITAIVSGAIGSLKGERWFLVLAFSLHALLYVISYLFNRGYVKLRLNEIVSLYDKYTEKFVVLAEGDLNDIKAIYIEPAMKNIESYLLKYKNVVIGLVIFMIILILTTILLPGSFFSNGNSTIKYLFI